MLGRETTGLASMSVLSGSNSNGLAVGLGEGTGEHTGSEADDNYVLKLTARR